MKRGLILLVLLWCMVIAMMSIGKPRERYVVYGNMKCPFTVKMLDELKSSDKNTVTFVDVSTKEGHLKFTKVTNKTDGVPYTVNTNTGEHIVGYRKV